MKLLIISIILTSLTSFAQTTIKKEKAKNGDVNMKITTKDKDSTISSTSTITKKEMDEAAPFYKAMSECKPTQIKHADGDMVVEQQIHGLVKDKCKVTAKATVSGKMVSHTTCLLTAEHRKTIKTDPLENYSKIMMDGKTCSMETEGPKF